MTLSMLQDAQTARGIAAAIAANMKHDEEMRSMSVSPPTMSNDAAALYARLFSNSTTAMSMLTPQFMAANRNAAALMAAQIPMSMRATLAASAGQNYFQTHPIFGAWPSPSPSSNGHSPPISPISPALSVKSIKKINNNNNIVSTTTDIVPKKGTKRKTGPLKKDLLSPPITISTGPDVPMPHELLSPGPISPPTSGSSPQSNGSIEQQHPPPSTTILLPTSSKDPTRDKVFTCKICSRSFGYKHVLQNHERTHTGEKPFECPECHKRFTRDHHLKTHMRLHTGEKPYHCSHCDRHFVQVANLRRHLRVHTGERPYTCEMCKSKFSDSNQLKAHMLIHNGEKPFECERCHVRFRRRHHLVHHKCGLPSPPSPAMSDHKSASSRSDISIDDIPMMDGSLSGKPILQQYLAVAAAAANVNVTPTMFDTTTTTTTSTTIPMLDDGPIDLEKRNRKSLDIRRILRMPTQISHIPSALPEQTEPEDLSMHSPRSNVSHDDPDLEDLDDAAALYMKQQHHQLKQHYAIHPLMPPS